MAWAEGVKEILADAEERNLSPKERAKRADPEFVAYLNAVKKNLYDGCADARLPFIAGDVLEIVGDPKSFLFSARTGNSSCGTMKVLQVQIEYETRSLLAECSWGKFNDVKSRTKRLKPRSISLSPENVEAMAKSIMEDYLQLVGEELRSGKGDPSRGFSPIGA